MKESLRRDFRDLERNRPSDRVQSASQAICEQLIEMDVFKSANTVGAFLSLPTEVQTDDILKACWEQGKDVCVPYYLPQSRYYGMSRLAEDAELKEKQWKLREPAEPEPMDISMLDLILVPALAFDVNGVRLGHGGGHYDRLLLGVNGFRLGLAFHEQVVEALPAEPHDEPVFAILTEQKYFHDLQ